MYSFIFFYLVSSFISAMCCDLMSIVQVAFVNPLINELCMYVYCFTDCTVMKVAKPERCNTSQGNAERRLGCDEIFNNDNFTTFLLILTY